MKKSLFLIFSLLVFPQSMTAQHSISGYIVSLETARPITDATVFLKDKYNLPFDNPDSLKATTDSTGFYRIGGIQEGTYIISTWTTYRAMDQRYAMVLASDRIEVDRNLSIDFVFSEIAFKYRLDYKFRKRAAFKSKKAAKAFLDTVQKRNVDLIARRATSPKIYIDSKRDTLLTWLIKNISDQQQ
ncbi:carboxypeptidase-like regulatory domain-containing protein [Fodinibius halophilus]|uniref:Carboxypeptidase regulatory-like domain-containing protein n=1 Tax=Fodinibius halophilus TaxID=1736908 RepID=A0A6M1TFX5_9BACT|nr:carboxypeptidase-like regulatory domain-containing protein [Fodinibius halophilus]NGP89704.1 carboxypeptidase regulatory-like domain-containing protein [Fodinibius halophilus]